MLILLYELNYHIGGIFRGEKFHEFRILVKLYTEYK